MRYTIKRLKLTGLAIEGGIADLHFLFFSCFLRSQGSFLVTMTAEEFNDELTQGIGSQFSLCQTRTRVIPTNLSFLSDTFNLLQDVTFFLRKGCFFLLLLLFLVICSIFPLGQFHNFVFGGKFFSSSKTRLGNKSGAMALFVSRQGITIIT